MPAMLVVNVTRMIVSMVIVPMMIVMGIARVYRVMRMRVIVCAGMIVPGVVMCVTMCMRHGRNERRRRTAP